MILAAWYFWAGVCLGIFGALAAIARVATRGSQLVEFYINGTVLNKTSAVKDRVRGRLGGKHTYGLGGIVNKIVTDDKFTQKLALQVADGAPEEMKVKANLNVDAEVCFTAGCYFVVKLSVHRINTIEYLAQLLKLKPDNQKLHYLQLFYDIIGTDQKHWCEDRFTELVAKKVRQKIGQNMKANLWRRAKVDVNVEGVSSSEQARHLFKALNEITIVKTESDLRG
jgi:hypothetical protein